MGAGQRPGKRDGDSTIGVGGRRGELEFTGTDHNGKVSGTRRQTGNGRGSWCRPVYNTVAVSQAMGNGRGDGVAIQ